MVQMRSVVLPSTSGADDAALHALKDASLAIADMEDACIRRADGGTALRCVPESGIDRAPDR